MTHEPRDALGRQDKEVAVRLLNWALDSVPTNSAAPRRMPALVADVAPRLADARGPQEGDRPDVAAQHEREQVEVTEHGGPGGAAALLERARRRRWTGRGRSRDMPAPRSLALVSQSSLTS